MTAVLAEVLPGVYKSHNGIPSLQSTNGRFVYSSRR